MLLRPLRSLLYTQIRNNCTNKCTKKCSNNCNEIVKQLDNINTNLTHIFCVQLFVGFGVVLCTPIIFR